MIVTVVSRVISCLGGVERFMTLDFKGSNIGFYQGSFLNKGGIPVRTGISFFTFTSPCTPLSISKQQAVMPLITA